MLEQIMTLVAMVVKATSDPEVQDEFAALGTGLSENLGTIGKKVDSTAMCEAVAKHGETMLRAFKARPHLMDHEALALTCAVLGRGLSISTSN